MTAVKFAKGSDELLEGLGIPYGGPYAGKDLDREFFSADTDFCLDWFDQRPLLYDHGTDPSTKAEVVGRVIGYETTDAGIWTKAQLDKRHRYHSAIADLVGRGALGFSSGAMPHLVEKDTKSGHIKRWPWVEESLTPTPANPDAVVYAVKTADAIAHLQAIDNAIPEPLVVALKALDDGLATKDGLEHGPFTEHGQRVLADLGVFVDRASERTSARGKSGRVLSAANRALLAQLLETVDSLGPLRVRVQELLTTTDPDSGKAALSVMAEFEAIQARLNGVPV